MLVHIVHELVIRSQSADQQLFVQYLLNYLHTQRIRPKAKTSRRAKDSYTHIKNVDPTTTAIYQDTVKGFCCSTTSTRTSVSTVTLAFKQIAMPRKGSNNTSTSSVHHIRITSRNFRMDIKDVTDLTTSSCACGRQSSHVKPSGLTCQKGHAATSKKHQREKRSHCTTNQGRLDVTVTATSWLLPAHTHMT